ncbi:MAG: LamG-like jellyroll fold domain-containing protein [Bacteroidales bacterium]
MKKFYLLLLLSIIFKHLSAQDTLVVQTFTLDSVSREGIFQFPDEPGTTYEKIIMQYRMRCHDALVGNGNVGCYEWDYHCNTVVTDSSQIDSLWSTHPTHIITGSNANPFYYIYGPTYYYYQYVQQEVLYNEIISENSAVIGNGTMSLDIPFNTANKQGKTQILFTQSELASGGLIAGDITGIRLTIETAASEVKFLKIRVKNSPKSELDMNHPDVDGFTEVYFLNTAFTSPDQYSFNFYNPFAWNGFSGLIFEFSYTLQSAGNANLVAGHLTTNTFTTISTNAEDRFLSFSQGDFVEVPAEAFAPVDSLITISFWQYGDINLQPFNSYIFEGADANNNRVINCHLPWGNGRIYWDAGNSGTSSYDRIDKDASFEEYAGQWNHWALTKNATTGEMKMYLNGELWHSGTDKFHSMAGITKFNLAGNRSSGVYAGYINEFRIWNAELDEASIKEWMYRDVDNSHPNYNDLLVYYKMDEPDGEIVTDHSPNGYDGTISGQPLRITLKGHQLSRNFIQLQERPNIEIVQGEYDQTIIETIYLDSLQKPFNTVYDYYVENFDLILNDTNYYWESGYMHVYDEANTIVDSIFIAYDDFIEIETLEYYKKWPSRYELLSFITPYGNGLDLGEEGKMWEFDVTDFTPILKGEKYLSIEGVGKNSEELDIRFLFIEGTPPRDVLSIQSIWPIASASSIWYSAGANAIWEDQVYEPRDVMMNPDASYFKIRSAITGHGQNGEFNPKWHYFNLNEGGWEFEFLVWNECSTIPIYPQGGTWIYDRAGWCPGDPTTLFEFDITDLVTPGESHMIDYGLTNISGLTQADYRISNQLVTYGPANFNLDAAIKKVGNPNKSDAAFERFNPSCMFPTVIIQNTGSETLTSLDIEYHVDYGDVLTYSWTGNLEFLDTAHIELPIPNFTFWFGASTHRFNVNIGNPNGQTDEYEPNNHYSIEYEIPDAYEDDEALVLECMTNNKGWQTSYTVMDASGNIILERSDLEDNTLYTDDLNLAPGCYRIRIDDSADDGLYWWHNSSQGTGSFKLKNDAGYTLENFEPECGRFAVYEFTVYNETSVNEREQSTIVSVFPNPAKEQLNIELSGFENQNIKATLHNTSMATIFEKQIHVDGDHYIYELSLEELPAGVYFVNILTLDKNIIKKIVKK